MLVGFALLVAGFMSLAAPSDADVEANRQRGVAERRKGLWRYVAFCISQMATARSQGMSLVISHWPERPGSRRMIYIGAVCLAVAAVIGYHLGVFDS